MCAAMFKLSPRYLCSYDQDTFNNLCSPTDVLPYGQADVVDVAPCLHPLFDYVPPDLINLIISNMLVDPVAVCVGVGGGRWLVYILLTINCPLLISRAFLHHPLVVEMPPRTFIASSVNTMMRPTLSSSSFYMLCLGGPEKRGASVALLST